MTRGIVILDPTTKKFYVRERCRDETRPVSGRKGRVRLPPPALSEVNIATLGWLAGMVDGDGTICMAKTKPPSRGYIRYTPIIQVSGSYELCLISLRTILMDLYFQSHWVRNQENLSGFGEFQVQRPVILHDIYYHT